jgi:hypothetical protein
MTLEGLAWFLYFFTVYTRLEFLSCMVFTKAAAIENRLFFISISTKELR